MEVYQVSLALLKQFFRPMTQPTKNPKNLYLTKPNPTRGSTQPMDNSDQTRKKQANTSGHSNLT